MMIQGSRGGGSVYETTHNNKSCWCADRSITENGKRRKIRAYGDTAKSATANLNRLLRKRITQGMKPVHAAPTLKQFLPVWLTHVKASAAVDSTRLKYEQDQKNHIIPLLGGRRLDTITGTELEHVFYTDLPAYLGPRAVQHCFTELNSLFIYAIKHDVITKNPMRTVERPKYKPKIRDKQEKFISRYISMNRNLLKWLETPDCPFHDDYPRVLFMMLGLRRAEVLGLTWDCVTNLDRKNHAILTIQQELMRHETNSGLTGWYIAGRTKNNQKRTILLPERWRKALIEEKHKNRIGKNEWNKNLIFLTPRGACINYDKHGQQWKKILTTYYNKDKKIPAPLPDEYYWRPHDNRHIAASIMIESGMPLHTVQDLLGHLDSAMTDYYTHSTKESKNEAMTSLDNKLK
ncbi:MAG: site-specific integrase [Bifidobacterium crudilactis]|jgi:integrase|nr:site-specific integrase [Bifidobacterium crudilactis]